MSFPNFRKKLEILDSLNLDPAQYMITGGGSLAVHGIRDCHDLDVLVTDEVGQSLKFRFLNNFHEYPVCDTINIDDVDLMFNFKGSDRPYSTQFQLDNADMIDGRKYQTLEHVKFFKKQMAREKDLADIAAIDEYLAKHS